MSCGKHCPLGRRASPWSRRRGAAVAAVACGIDWAQDHHDVALVDESGVVVASVRIGDDAAGLSQVLVLLAEHDPVGGKRPVAIETSQGLLVTGLCAPGRQVFAIN